MFWLWKVDFVLVNYATSRYEICVAMLICWTWGRLTCELVIWALHPLLFSVIHKSVSTSGTNSSDTQLFLPVSCDLSECLRQVRGRQQNSEDSAQTRATVVRVRLGESNRRCAEKPRITESKLCAFQSGPHKMPSRDPWNTLLTGHGFEHCTDFLGS